LCASKKTPDFFTISVPFLICLLLFYSYLKIPGYRTTTFSFGTNSKAGYSMFRNTL